MRDDSAKVLDRAAAAGVDNIIVPAYDRASWREIENLSTIASMTTANARNLFGI